MIKCLIIDDEPLAQEIIANYVLQSGKIELVKKCSNVLEAFSVLEKQPIDLLFLDIKMPLINGLDFIKSLKSPPAVIFTTAFSEYAVASYEIEAVDYLLKPITYVRFARSIEKYLKLNTSSDSENKNYLYFKVKGKLLKILYADILYAESMGNYMKIVTSSNYHITYLTTKALTDMLPTDIFLRVHRSFIVNVSHISSIGRNTLTINDIEIPIGENFREKVRKLK
jgi:two-component system LytT family response regulator